MTIDRGPNHEKAKQESDHQAECQSENSTGPENSTGRSADQETSKETNKTSKNIKLDYSLNLIALIGLTISLFHIAYEGWGTFEVLR